VINIFNSAKNQYKGVGEILASYFKIYGSLTAVLSSPYLHFSVLIVFLCNGFWRQAAWWDVPISVLPGMASFSLAGFAMLMAFGDQDFKKLLSDKDQSSSAILGIASTFTHFIILQIASLILAIICKSRPLSTAMADHEFVRLIVLEYEYVFLAIKFFAWGLSFLIFIYAVLSAIPAALSIFRTTRWFNSYSSDD
jgi:hypothetical protein